VKEEEKWAVGFRPSLWDVLYTLADDRHRVFCEAISRPMRADSVTLQFVFFRYRSAKAVV
jgi:hypothetical protein